MNTKKILEFFVKCTQLGQMTLFFLLNRFRYKKLGFKSLIIRPLVIVGRKYISIHQRVIIKNHASIFALKNDDTDNPEIEIGIGCSLGYCNHIAAVKKVVLGNYILTANNVYISDNLHEYENIKIPIMHQPIRFKAEVAIGDGSWIGENACIIGAKIGKNCIIGANSVVTRDIPDYSVAAGVPAVVIKTYDTKKQSWQTVNNRKD